MLPKNLSTTDLEDIYDALASAIDNAEATNESKLLTKLVLLLSNSLGDKALVVDTIEIAEKNL